MALSSLVRCKVTKHRGKYSQTYGKSLSDQAFISSFVSLLVRSSSSKLSSRLDVLDFMAGVLDPKPIAGTAMGDMGFGDVADVAVVVACLVAFAGFLEAKPITATEDVGCGVVAAAVGKGGREAGTECYYGDDEGRE